MKKPQVILFILRLFFYLSVAALPVIHPGIPVSYDRIGLVQWFLIVPVGALIAFIPAPGGRLRNKFIIGLAALLPLSLWAGGWFLAAVTPFLAGLAAFVLTLLLFHYPRWGKLSLAEPFFLAWICFRILAFSRSGEEASGESLDLTQFIMVWTGVVFLFYNAVLYFCLFPKSSAGAKPEGAVFGFAALAVLALVIFALPADYIRNTIVENLLPDQREKMSKPSDNDWGIPEEGGGRREARRTVPNDGSGQGPSLRTLSEHDWPGEGSRRGREGRGGTGEGQTQQYTVMVVASKYEPVYMGNSIRSGLDPVRGFLANPDETLNRLPAQRLFVTWFDNEPVFDLGRERHEVFSLSTLSQKYFPYRPFAVEPTILSENTGPFRYIHRLTSNVHPDEPLEMLFAPVRDLSPFEIRAFESYLEFPLENADREVFSAHLDRVLESWQAGRESIMGDLHNEYVEKIAAILIGFSDFQYNANDGNDYTISHLVDFLANTKEGDCVEFSNTAAILGRLAGIPSRVVTGYLASEGLQSTAHLRGLAALRSRIPVLQEFPFEDLFLVTDAHGHSWPQFYIPDYGWIDFEATRFAIAPMGGGDPNLRDVVIPYFDENQVFAPVRAFPWRAVLRVITALAIVAVAGAYSLRYGRELVLYLASRQGGREGARSLYLLLLSKLAADGKPIKPVSKTAPEYAQLFSGAGEGGAFAAFARLYTELRWREFTDPAEKAQRFELLKDEYRKILTENRRKGPAGFIIRVFSLRGLAYL